MKRLTFIVLACAGTPIGDAITGPEKLAKQDDAYCRSIGARGSDYTKCRLSMTQHRDERHTAARNGAADALQSTSEAMLRNGQRGTTTCTTTGPLSRRTTTCD